MSAQLGFHRPDGPTHSELAAHSEWAGRHSSQRWPRCPQGEPGDGTVSLATIHSPWRAGSPMLPAASTAQEGLP